jgi:hypothetical protein
MWIQIPKPFRIIQNLQDSNSIESSLSLFDLDELSLACTLLAYYVSSLSVCVCVCERVREREREREIQSAPEPPALKGGGTTSLHF